MHFSIPDTEDFISDTGSFTGFNIHINGTFHCCLRYKQLHNLHEQLKRSLPTLVLPHFPPKKLLPLTPNQLEQRRIGLERYIQLVGQDPVLSRSDLLRTFFLNAQQESSFTDCREVTIDIYLMNGYRISTNIYTTEYSSKVLEKACLLIDLPKEYLYYFSLYLIRQENNGDITIMKKLMDFESPYISQKQLNNCKIVIRKSYWDINYDLELMRDRIALNLLYIQALSDVERHWIVTTREILEQLSNLQARGNKREYIEIVRKLPGYGCIKFQRSIVDYPQPNTPATIIIGNKELNLLTSNGMKIQETKFKVTRIRCWRVTTIHSNEELSSNSSSDSQPHLTNLELSFEYLMAKNLLKWITICSEQAMLISVCLQSIVDELLNQKSGIDITQNHIVENTQLSYIRRDGSNHRIKESSSNDTITSLNENDTPNNNQQSSMRKKIKEKFSTTVTFKNGKESVHNEAFEDIGDDDL
uniref:Putative sorting nexin n=1 Tax=Corethrella appendiculata TaxID=1370023 RepID=U5EWH9_9DIPT